MTREEEFTHEGFVYANNICMERKCELFEVKDIAHDFVQGAIYADQHPKEGLWDAEKVCNILRNKMDSNWFHEKVERGDYDSIIEDLRKSMGELKCKEYPHNA